jgi:hypothetical protein
MKTDDILKNFNEPISLSKWFLHSLIILSSFSKAGIIHLTPIEFYSIVVIIHLRGQ